MITFTHTADIHFGVENYGRIDPKTGIHTRLLDFHKALSFCIDYTIAHQHDLFIFAGDAYKTANPSPTQQKLLLQCFLKLYKANIPVVIVVGNHDNPLSFGKANALDLFSDLPVDGFYVINKPQSLNLTTKNGPVQIVGIPWPTRNTISISNRYIYQSAEKITEHIAQSVGNIIQHLANQLDPNLPAILTGHLTVSSGIFSGSEKRAIYGTDPVLLPSQLAIAPFDYVALGHLHRYQNLNSAPGGIPIVYAGSIERVDFGERKEDKGFCVVTIPNKIINKTQDKIENNLPEQVVSVSCEFIKTPMRPMIQLDIELHDQADQTEQILAKIKQVDLRDAIVKIKYYLPENLKSNLNLRAITQACAAAMELVGVFPVQKIGIRPARSVANTEMDLAQLLKNYFMGKQLSAAKQASLISKALDLQDDLNNL
ncbi:MAG TPA: exonuclease subunit SbcD [Candidatus Babeliales bacterium]|nr:exonuclease subunit SbcD [Candidatus Babeliales bacterium]